MNPDLEETAKRLYQDSEVARSGLEWSNAPEHVQRAFRHAAEAEYTGEVTPRPRL